jgi:GEVED domain/Sortilin, neurotensin receptor 3,
MNMKKLIIITLCLLNFSAYCQKYQEMMLDNSVNFYDVCKEADSFFKSIEKKENLNEEESAFSKYQMWKATNEPYYYPSGNRMLDHNAPAIRYQELKTEEANKKDSRRLFINGGWKNLGPDSVYTITGHYAAGLGRVECVLPNKNNSNQLYFSSRSGGLWRTNNNGVTWIHNTDFLPASGVVSFDAKPTYFDSALIVVNNARNRFSHGVFRTANGGQTFTPTNFVPANIGTGGLASNFQIYTIKYHPTIANLVFVCTSNGLYRSTNDLQTWTLISNSLQVTDIDFHRTNSNIIYIYSKAAASVNKIYKSVDTGATFVGTLDFAGNAAKPLSISTSTNCAACVYVVSDKGIWVSIDEAATFTLRSDPSVAGKSMVNANVSDIDTSIILGGFVDVSKSTDGGVTITQSTYWSLNNAMHGVGDYQSKFDNSLVYIHPDVNYHTCVNGVFYAGTDGFAVKSIDNGVTWIKLNLNTNIRENYSISTSQSNQKRVITGSQDNGTSLRIENGWLEINAMDGMDNLIHPLNPDYMIGSAQYGDRFRWIDGGFRYAKTTPVGYTGHWETPLVGDPNNQMSVYSFHNRVLKSEDFGDTWLEISNPFSNNLINQAACAYNNSKIMAISLSDSIKLSTDQGLTWKSIKNTLPNYFISDIAFDPTNDSTILVSYAELYNDLHKIYITKNLGATWTNITYNLKKMPIRSIVVDNTPERNIYVGAEIGIYTKKINDTSWSLYNVDLPNTAVTDLEINYGANTLKASTWGRGLWEYALKGRTMYPAIVLTTISNPPTLDLPKTTVLQTVTSDVIYTGSTISSVYVMWSWDTAAWNTNNVIPMNFISGNTYQAISALPNDTAGRKMFFKVVAVGANNDTSETYKFQYTIQPFITCPATGNTSGGNLYIQNFTCDTVSNNATLNDGYKFYPNKIMTLKQGSTYNANANFSINYSTNDFLVWIDYNNDKEFSANEKVIADMNTGNIGAGSFTVPYNTVADTVVMRVRLAYLLGDSLPCGNFRGEVEDYLVVLKQNIPLSTSNTILIGNCVGDKNYITLEVMNQNEIANVAFERSADAINFETIATLSKPFTLSPQQLWKYIDINSSNEKYMYRAKITSTNGEIGYSNSINLSPCNNNSVVLLYPNPVNSELKLVNNAPIDYEILNSLGQIIKIGKAINTIDVSTLPIGMYYFISNTIKIEFVKQ